MTAADSTWWSLIRGAAEGRAPDRDVFARRYDPVIRAYLGARRRHSSLFRETDDAAQEVFVDCFKQNGALQRVDAEHGSGFAASSTASFGMSPAVSSNYPRFDRHSEKARITLRLGPAHPGRLELPIVPVPEAVTSPPTPERRSVR